MVSDRKYLHRSSFHLRAHNRVGGHVDLNYSRREIRHGTGRVLVRHFRHFESDSVKIASKHKIGESRGGGPVELAGLCTRKRLQFLQRIDIQRSWDADSNDGFRNARNRNEIVRIIWKFVMKIGMRGE